MREGYSAHLHDDVHLQVQAAHHSNGMVNVAAVAEEVRRRNLAENVALEDIEHLVVEAAQLYGAAMEFDGLAVDMDHVGLVSEAGIDLPGQNRHEATRERAIPSALRQPKQLH